MNHAMAPNTQAWYDAERKAYENYMHPDPHNPPCNAQYEDISCSCSPTNSSCHVMKSKKAKIAIGSTCATLGAALITALVTLVVHFSNT